MKTLLALIPLAWSTCMPSPYTPNPANNPATISLPNPGDPVASAVADQAWKDVADRAAFTGSSIAFANLATQTGAIDGTPRLVSQMGWYIYTTGTPYTADGVWVVTATGMGSGQWIHQTIAFTHLHKMPAIGPTPGDVGFALATPAGKINPQFESLAMIDMFASSAGLAGTDSRPFADPTTPSDELYGDILPNFATAPPIAGDIVRARISAAVVVADIFRLCVLVSQDGGGTYTLVTPRVTATLPVTWTAPSAGNYIQVDLSFDYVVTASPAPTQIRTSVRAQANGGISLTARFNEYVIMLMRP